MDNIKVRIKLDIAKTGCGFCDIEHDQELLPFENGKLKTDKVFSVKKTLFIRSKLSSGELVSCEKETK
ncbi:MAG: hypothetical protein JXK07_10020 [Spirochaetes bacterium]|nr:hypothetical protein [Spirochaetota bacterium]MBN2771266.1 hypothetical protein [Spirochaetota bacterium]